MQATRISLLNPVVSLVSLLVECDLNATAAALAGLTNAIPLDHWIRASGLSA